MWRSIACITSRKSSNHAATHRSPPTRAVWMNWSLKGANLFKCTKAARMWLTLSCPAIPVPAKYLKAKNRQSLTKRSFLITRKQSRKIKGCRWATTRSKWSTQRKLTLRSTTSAHIRFSLSRTPWSKRLLLTVDTNLRSTRRVAETARGTNSAKMLRTCLLTTSTRWILITALAMCIGMTIPTLWKIQLN